MVIIGNPVGMPGTVSLVPIKLKNFYSVNQWHLVLLEGFHANLAGENKEKNYLALPNVQSRTSENWNHE